MTSPSPPAGIPPARPDLSTSQGRAAYRRELIAIARKRRALGFVALAMGTLLIAWPRIGGPWMLGAFSTQSIGVALLLIGLALFAWVFAKRIGHHKHRMRTPHPADIAHVAGDPEIQGSARHPV